MASRNATILPLSQDWDETLHTSTVSPNFLWVWINSGITSIVGPSKQLHLAHVSQPWESIYDRYWGTLDVGRFEPKLSDSQRDWAVIHQRQNRQEYLWNKNSILRRFTNGEKTNMTPSPLTKVWHLTKLWSIFPLILHHLPWLALRWRCIRISLPRFPGSSLGSLASLRSFALLGLLAGALTTPEGHWLVQLPIMSPSLRNFRFRWYLSIGDFRNAPSRL